MATPLELDQMKTRVMARAQGTRRSGAKGSLLKTRFAITMMLVVGILLSCTGAGLAVSGSSGSGNAGAAQYSKPQTNNNGNVLGQEEQPAATQEANQVAATTSSGSLPFTGLAAIPILALGVGLFGTGLVVRRTSRRSEQA